MLKNMCKRTWLNIIRKPSKSIVLLIIMFIMANLVIASLAISNSVEESMEYAKESLGSEVFLNTDMEQVKGSMNREQIDSSMDMQDMSSKIESMLRPESTMNMVMDIGSSEYVKDFTYSLTAFAEPIEFELYESEVTSNRPTGGMMSGGMGATNRLNIMGINSYAFIPEVESNTFEISDGEYFDETTDNEILISYELSELNGINVGDTIQLQKSDSEDIVEYTVRGIFTANSSGYENNIYMNVESAAILLDEETYNDGDYSVSDVVFTLNNHENSEIFIEEVNKKYDFEELGLILDIDSSAYDQMIGPIEQVGSFAGIILWAVIIAAVLIIALIINNSIKSRKYEMGVLMSLGAPKSNIIGQICLELIIVATIGFVLSIGTSQFLANSLSEGLLNDQIEMSEEQSEENFGRPTSGMQSGNMRPGMQSQETEETEAIDEIDVSISVQEYLILFVIGYLISFIAMIIPTVNIMKYEPKTILTGRE